VIFGFIVHPYPYIFLLNEDFITKKQKHISKSGLFERGREIVHITTKRESEGESDLS
jgi:hypothetical protein